MLAYQLGMGLLQLFDLPLKALCILTEYSFCLNAGIAASDDKLGGQLPGNSQPSLVDGRLKLFRLRLFQRSAHILGSRHVADEYVRVLWDVQGLLEPREIGEPILECHVGVGLIQFLELDSIILPIVIPSGVLGQELVDIFDRPFPCLLVQLSREVAVEVVVLLKLLIFSLQLGVFDCPIFLVHADFIFNLRKLRLELINIFRNARTNTLEDRAQLAVAF